MSNLSRYDEAKEVYREAYEIMAAVDSPNDQIVSEAMNHLINALIGKNEFKDAKRYARINL